MGARVTRRESKQQNAEEGSSLRGVGAGPVEGGALAGALQLVVSSQNGGRSDDGSVRAVEAAWSRSLGGRIHLVPVGRHVFGVLVPVARISLFRDRLGDQVMLVPVGVGMGVGMPGTVLVGVLRRRLGLDVGRGMGHAQSGRQRGSHEGSGQEQARGPA